MDHLYSRIIALHALAGVAALVCFWMAALARKGSPLHRSVGRVFVWAMLLICVTALPMALLIWSSSTTFGIFLLYLVVITGSSVWLGYRAARWRGTQMQFRDAPYVAVAILNLVSGALVLAVGVNGRMLLLAGFSFVGLLLGAGMLQRLRSPFAGRNWRLREHYGAMVGSGAATHVAFTALGLRRVAGAVGWTVPDAVMLLGWIAPVLLAVVAGVLLDRRYARDRSAA